MGKLYYGDNLDVMRKYVKDETVDLVYLDPPFNSQANYNVLFREKSGAQSASQISAFSDFWEWDLTAMETLNSLLEDQKIPEGVTRTINNMVLTLGRNAISAYLVMMTARLLELRRVMK